MKKISILLTLVMILGSIYAFSAQADDEGIVDRVIRTIKTRGSTTTTTTQPAPTAVRG